MRKAQARLGLWTLLGTVVSALTLFGCADQMLPPDNSNGSPGQSDVKLALTGNVQLEEALPDDARLIVAWYVSATSPDYTYVYGEGTIDRQTNTFRITFDEDLPGGAINWYSTGTPSNAGGLGVGSVLVTTDQSLQQNQTYTNDVAEGMFYGTMDNMNIIYRQGSAPSPGTSCSSTWMPLFDQGYSLGIGVPSATCTFDGFTPLRSGQPTLIINSNEDRFTVVNWT